MKNKIIIKLKQIKPTALNRLYTPVIKWLNGKQVATIILSKEARATKKLIQSEVIRQRQDKMLAGHLLLYMDVDIVKVKSEDIDALLKQLFDALEGLCYKNDNQILDLRVRKHLNEGEDRITILIENIDVSQKQKIDI